jgi:hypothetical protein
MIDRDHLLRRTAMRRLLASFIAVLSLGVASPGSALAVDNLWAEWKEGVTQRSRGEVPFAILITLPAMLVTTPFWAGAWAVGKLKGKD